MQADPARLLSTDEVIALSATAGGRCQLPGTGAQPMAEAKIRKGAQRKRWLVVALGVETIGH